VKFFTFLMPLSPVDEILQPQQFVFIGASFQGSLTTVILDGRI
jgi:hypothetical protein